jgi:hypothetical protein
MSRNITCITGANVSETVKLKHRQDLFRANQLIERFNAAALLRNKDVNFGSNFEQFALSYLTQKEYRSLVNIYKIASNESYTRLVDSDKTKEIKKREDAFEKYLQRIQSVAAKKVENDQIGSASSFMNKNGFGIQILRYKNGAKNFTKMQSKIKTSRKIKPRNYSKIEKELIETRNIKEDLQSFNSSFRGTIQEYYNKLCSTLGKNATNKFIRKGQQGGLPPKSVLMRDAMRYIENLENQNLKRQSSKSYISATKEASSRYVGKTLTNSKSKREIELDTQKVNDINKAIKIFETQKSFISFEGIFNKLVPFIQVLFKKEYDIDGKEFNLMSEENKKIVLGNFLKNILGQYSKKFKNNSILKSGVGDLKKLEGVYFEKNKNKFSSLDNDNSNIAASPVYKNIENEYNSALAKYTIEQKALNEQMTELLGLKKLANTKENRQKKADYEKKIEKTKVKLLNLKTILDSAEARKLAYEKSFADSQLKQARVENKNFGASSSYKVLDYYNFPIKSDSEEEILIQQGTPEGKMVEQYVRDFLARFKAQLDRIAKSFEDKDNELYDTIFKMSRKLNSDFGVNLRSLDSVRRKLNEKLEEYADAGKEKQEVIELISLSKSELTGTEKKLISELAKLGVDIKKVNMKK